MHYPKGLKANDYLALDRTYLANERTLLAYGRSAFAVFLAGVTFLKLFPDDLALQILALACLALSPLLLLWGVYRTRRMHQQIQAYYKTPESQQEVSPASSKLQAELI
jgi:putative membrane protein